MHAAKKLEQVMKRAYTFDDVALVPQYNNIPSRTEPVLQSWMTRNRKIEIPILAANMDSVICERLADSLLGAGSVPIFHRFAPFEEQARWVRRYTDRVFVSSGLQSLQETRKLLDLGAAGVCIDVAHGHSEKMFKMVQELKRSHPDREVIAGNVCTAMAYHDLVNAGADAVKVGIGPGAACTTRVVTGFGVPQFTAIRDCAAVAEKLRVPLIADGGVRGSRDLILALAAGASTVMLGKLFALTDESAAAKRPSAKDPARLEAKYRGQASEDFQKEFYGKVKDKTAPEGVGFWGPVSGSAEALIERLMGGLRNGMTYGGARSIKELQRKAEFVEVSQSYHIESFPRANDDVGVRNGELG
jgi:IMP dehydrogenase